MSGALSASLSVAVAAAVAAAAGEDAGLQRLVVVHGGGGVHAQSMVGQ